MLRTALLSVIYPVGWADCVSFRQPNLQCVTLVIKSLDHKEKINDTKKVKISYDSSNVDREERKM